MSVKRDGGYGRSRKFGHHEILFILEFVGHFLSYEWAKESNLLMIKEMNGDKRGVQITHLRGKDDSGTHKICWMS